MFHDHDDKLLYLFMFYDKMFPLISDLDLYFFFTAVVHSSKKQQKESATHQHIKFKMNFIENNYNNFFFFGERLLRREFITIYRNFSGFAVGQV